MELKQDVLIAQMISNCMKGSASIIAQTEALSKTAFAMIAHLNVAHAQIYWNAKAV